MAEVWWCNLPGPESDSPFVFPPSSLPPSPPYLRLTLSPPPSPSSPSPLSHTIALSLYLSLSSHSQTGESGLPGSHLCLYVSFSAFSPALLIVILQLKPCNSIPRARHQRQDTGEGKTALKINWGFLKELWSLLFFSGFLMIDLFRCLSSTRKDLKWEAWWENKKGNGGEAFAALVLHHRTKWCKWRHIVWKWANEDLLHFQGKRTEPQKETGTWTLWDRLWKEEDERLSQ